MTPSTAPAVGRARSRLGKDGEDRRPGRAALIREAGTLNRGVFTTRITEAASGTSIETRAITRATTESKVEKTE